MRIRKRPPQIPAPGPSDPAAGGGSLSGAGAGEVAAAGAAAGKGEIIMGTEGLHPSIEARGKGGPPWGADSVSWRPGQPGGGRRGGNSSRSDASCFGEVQQEVQLGQKSHKGKAEEDGAYRGSEEVPQDEKPGAGGGSGAGAAPPALGAHKTWNHVGAGGLPSGSGGGAAAVAAAAAANGLGAEAFVSATGAATGSRGELISASRKRKNISWSSGSSRSARSPSSSSSSVKTEISNGGGITSYMHVGEHQVLKDEEDNVKGEEQQQQHFVNGFNGGGNNTGGNIGSSSTTTTKNNGGKRRRSPAVLMEGSRCSRVNGRGWRCCQQTLVGYSLCEHHLGKGRLRSVSSVRCKKAGGGAGKQVLRLQQPVSGGQQLHDKQRRGLTTLYIDNEEEDDDETKPVVGVRRGKRIGIVKARSISSLLGQTSTDVASHAGAALDEVAPEMSLAASSAVLPGTVIRAPTESTAPAAAAAPLPPRTAANQEGISAVM